MTKKAVPFLLTFMVLLLLGGLYSIPALAAYGYYEAENAVLGGGAATITRHTGYFGTGAVDFPANGGYVEFRNIEFECGGCQTLLGFRYALDDTRSRTGRLTVNGVGQDITFSPTGAWTIWRTKEVQVNLTSGTSNTIRLASNGQDLAILDNLAVFIRTPPPPIYQAEYASRGGGVNYITTGTGFYGTGYVTFPASGGWIEFSNIEGWPGGWPGGSTLLRFRYKLGSTSSNTGRLTVNGINQNITFSPTGSWTTWAIKEVTVNFNSGQFNTIRLASSGQYLANLDQMEVVPNPWPD